MSERRHPTVRPDNVRLARRGDETALFALVCDSDDEWAIGLRDDSKVRDVIELAVSGHDTQRPSFGVIEVPDDEIWTIAAFVKKLPSVSDDDFKAWTARH